MRSQNAKHWAQNWPADQRTLIRIIKVTGNRLYGSLQPFAGIPRRAFFSLETC